MTVCATEKITRSPPAAEDLKSIQPKNQAAYRLAKGNRYVYVYIIVSIIFHI